MTQRVDFIDVSHWQGAIDWPAVDPDVIGVIAKCTEAENYLDDMYQTNRHGALACGLAFAPYHYLHQGDGAAQMAWFLSQAGTLYGERVVIDYEEAEPAVTMTELKAAVDYLRTERPDLQITIYGASKLTDDVNRLTDTSWLDGTSLWAARYSKTNQPTVGKAWVYWSAWQFSDSGTVPGIAGHVDVNTFNGSPEACLAWLSPTGVEPSPTPLPPEPRPDPEPELAVAQILRAHGREVAINIESSGFISIWIDGELVPG